MSDIDKLIEFCGADTPNLRKILAELSELRLALKDAREALVIINTDTVTIKDGTTITAPCNGIIEYRGYIPQHGSYYIESVIAALDARLKGDK